MTNEINEIAADCALALEDSLSPEQFMGLDAKTYEPLMGDTDALVDALGEDLPMEALDLFAEQLRDSIAQRQAARS